MSDETRRSPEEMLIVEWSGTAMRASGADRPIGADAWPAWSILPDGTGAGPGLVNTDLSGLVSGVQSWLEPPTGFEGESPAWQFALDASTPETLRLPPEHHEPDPVEPSRSPAGSLFGTGRPVPAGPRSPASRRQTRSPVLATPPRAPDEAPRTGVTGPRPTTAAPRTPAAGPRPQGTGARRFAVRPGAIGSGTGAPRRATAAGPMADLLVALRLRTSAATPPAGSGGRLVSVMDLSRLAAAGERPFRSPVPDVGTGRSLVAAAPGRPVPAGARTTRYAGPGILPTSGLQPSARRAPVAPAGPGMTTRWDPGMAPARPEGAPLDALGPALSRLIAVAEGPSASAAPALDSREGALPDAAFIDLSPDAPPAEVAPAAAPRRSLATRPRSGQGAPPAGTPWTQPPATGRRFVDRTVPERSAASLAAAARLPGPAGEPARASLAPIPGASNPIGPQAVVARTPAAAGSLALSVFGPPVLPGLASGRPFVPARTGFQPSARATGRFPVAVAPGPAAAAGSPRLPVGSPAFEDGPGALLTIGAWSRPYPSGTDRDEGRIAAEPPIAGRVPVLPERPAPREAGPRPPAAPTPDRRSASPDALARAILSPMGRTSTGLPWTGTILGPWESDEPESAGPSPVPGIAGWTLSGEEAALVATGAESAPGIPARESIPAARGSARRRSGAPLPAPAAPPSTPAAPPSGSAANRTLTATTSSRRALPLSAMVRAGLAAADRPMSRTGLGIASKGPRRPPFGALPVPSDGPAGPFVTVADRPRPGFGPSRAPVLPDRAPAPSVHRMPSFLGVPLPEGFDLVGLRSPLTPTFDRPLPGAAARDAEDLSSLRQTLFRALRALPPVAPGRSGGGRSAAGAGTADLVEGIRRMDRDRSIAPKASSASGSLEAAAAIAERPAPGSRPDRGEADSDRAMVDTGRSPADAGPLRGSDSVPTRPRAAVRGDPVQGSLPGLPAAPSPAFIDVSLSPRASFGAGGPGTARPGGLPGGGSVTSGPTYRGAYPLVSTALSAVASTAMAASRGEEPATRPAESAGSPADAAAPAGPAVDLEGLAAEMSERILRRFRRDKERRGFYG